jgi:hypothetical protein
MAKRFLALAGLVLMTGSWCAGQEMTATTKTAAKPKTPGHARSAAAADDKLQMIVDQLKEQKAQMLQQQAQIAQQQTQIGQLV